MKRKILAAFSAAALLWASGVQAEQTRDVVESSMAAHAKLASAATTEGVAALQAGDTTKGCANLRNADMELGITIDLLSQDADLVRADTSLSEADRASQLNDVLMVQQRLSGTRAKLQGAIQQHCS